MLHYLSKLRKRDAPTPRNIRRTTSLKKINQSFLRIREMNDEDDKYIRKLLFDHFRSQTFPAIIYWVVQHVHDLIAIMLIISFLMPLRSLLYFCICFLIYLYVRARFEIEKHIKHSCPDLDAVYDTYRTSSGSNFWVGYFSKNGEPENGTEQKSESTSTPRSISTHASNEVNNSERESIASPRTDPGTESSHSLMEGEGSARSNISTEGQNSASLKKMSTQVEATMKLKDVLTPTNCEENEILGCIGIMPYRNQPNVAQMVRLVVSKKCRNMKVGSQMLNHLENFAMGFGYSEIRVYTNNLNTAYLQFLKQNGFVIRQIVRRGLMRGDLIIWNKTLSQPNDVVTEIPSRANVDATFIPE